MSSQNTDLEAPPAPSPGVQGLLTDSAIAYPLNTAVVHPGFGSITYRDLDNLTDRLRNRLLASGIVPGDRVGVCLPKSIDSIVAIYGILKTGAAYVPVDPTAPASRNAYILDNCRCRAAIVHASLEQPLRDELAKLEGETTLLNIEPTGSVAITTLPQEQIGDGSTRTYRSAGDDLAYILYTSGSTGKPKGVMLTHNNALSFVEWCSRTFLPTASDRCSSHAPLHFDLSILDLHMAIKHGATVVLIDERVGKDPRRIVEVMEQERITIWYSAPSILSLLVQFGSLDKADLSALRLVLFAGEVFPIKYLRELKNLVPGPTYYNLYGPTETNVCTYYRVPRRISKARTRPVPIGWVCEHLQALVIDEEGQPVDRGEEGELTIRGGNVTLGYWELPDNNGRAFHSDDQNNRWYRTGDLVVEDKHGCFTFIGRRDRMVKKRGYRIELGEIEAGLYDHEKVDEAAVVACPDDDLGLKIIAFIAAKADNRPSILELKAFCAKRLPSYMVPDTFVFADTLPKTSTDKVDYQKLLDIC